MRRLILCVVLVAACGKAPCTVKHLSVSTTFDGRTFNDADLTAAEIAGWSCSLTGSRNVAGIVIADYACTRCD